MSKKGSAKKENVPKSPAVEDQSWRRVLAESPIVTADWRCQVSILVESEPRDTGYLEMFTEAAKNEDRMVIKTITFEETIIMVKQIGAGKEITPDEKVFEIANNFMKQGNPIPEEILAMLIKHQILKLKTDDLNIKNDQKELSDGLKNESVIMMGKQPDKGVKPSIPEKKYHTDLRELGEEWKDRVYVEDYPKDGPELYIALIGFRKCGLIHELLKLNVPLVAVVKIETDADPLENDMDREKLSLSNSNSSHSKLSKFSPEIAIFWEDLELAKGAMETALLYKGVAFISFEPPYKETLPEGKSGKEIVYDEMSFLLYDIQDLTRQHFHYIETMTIIDINESITRKIYLEDMTVYTNMMKSVSLESTSVAFILHGLVAQVASLISPNDNIEQSLPYKDDPTPNPVIYDDSITGKAQSKINNIFKHKKITDEICESYDDTKKNDLKIIPWGDFIMLECYFSDPGLIDLRNVILQTLSSLPIPKLWDQLPPDGDGEAHFKLILFHECMREHNISLDSAARILNLMCCKKLCEERFFYDYQLYHKSLRKRINKLRSQISPIPSDVLLKSKSFTYGENPNVNLVDCSLRSVIRFASTIQYPKLRTSDDYDEVIDILEKPEPLFEQELKEDHFDINDYDSFEELTYGSTLQALNKAYFEFNTSNIKYCPVTDKIIISFFNKVRNGMNEFIWQRYIPSPVCLRDFFDYVFQEEYNWIVTEENIHDASLSFKLDATSKVELENTTPGENNSIDYDKEMVLKDSLKDSGLLNPAILQEVSGISPGPDNKGQNISASTISNDNPDMKLTSDDKEKEPFKFVGYNLGEDCVLTTGKSKSFLSKDGTAIYFDIYNNFGNSSCTSTRLTTSNYDLYIHSSFNSLTRKISDVQNLRFALKCGMNVIFKKSLKSSHDPNRSEENLYRPYHYLKFSWPNGLFIEPIWVQNSTLPLYIKQTLINEQNKSSTIYEELYRCYSLNGQILIYKRSGDIQVLYPDSSIYIFLESGDEFTSDTRKQFKSSVDEFLNADDLSGESLNAQTSNSDQSKASGKVVEDFMCYDATLSDGRYFKMRNGEAVYEDKLLVRSATDYLMGEVYSRRLDGTNTLLNKEGVQTTSFSDGSKISSYYILETYFPDTNINSDSQTKTDESRTNKIYVRDLEKVEENSQSGDSINFMDDAQIVSLVYVMEHPNYATVIVNNSTRSIQINLPRKIVVQIEENGAYKLEFENLSTAMLNNNELVIKDTKCFDCGTQTTTNINLMYSQEVGENLLTSEDGFNKIFTLNYSGDCFLLNKSDPSCCCWKDSKCDTNCCGRSLNRKDRRFFVLNRDLTGEEYIHKETRNIFNSSLKDVKWSSVERDRDIFNPQITYDTSIFPASPSMSQSWNMEPLIIDVKPKRLTFADLKEQKHKGIYPWMRPFPRPTFYGDGDKKSTQLPPPRAMILRILRKFIPEEWNISKNMETVTEKYICLMKTESRKVRESIPLLVTGIKKSEEELIKIGREMYDNILQSFDKQCVLSTSRKSWMVKQNIEKYLEQRAKEKLKEEFYREALRTQQVPKYEYPEIISREFGNEDERDIIEQ